MKCVVWSVKTVKCEVRSGARAWRARTHGLGWRTAHASSIDEKGFVYIFKATSAPPRAGTTGNFVKILTHNIFGYVLVYFGDAQHGSRGDVVYI